MKKRMRVNLSGQVALVTGAGRGIGQAIADAMVENGASVIYSDIDVEAVKTAARLSKRAEALEMDVGDSKRVEEVIDHVVAEWGRLDILVNNAGINTLDRVNIDQVSLAEWERIVRVDLTGLFLVSRLASRCMIRQKAGRIINIVSVVGLVPLRLQSAFVAAKAGAANLTRAMALELGPQGILVNAVAPGSILTDSTRRLFYGENGSFKRAAGDLIAHIPLGRPGTPKEVANAALFLAAPESSYINGHILTVDGGWSAGYLREF